MTRFRKEITGQLGAFWQQNAEKEVQAAVESATKDATVDENGAIAWKSNGSYLMDDFCEKLEMAMLWAQQIMLGKKTFAQVPRLLKGQVKEILIDSGMEELTAEN